MTAPQPQFRYPTRTRIIVVVVLALAIGGFALAAMTAETDGEDDVALSGAGGSGDEPDAAGVVARSPRRDAQALSQQPVSIQLAPGWTGELTFKPENGPAVPLPPDEVEITALNELVYTPGEGKTIERLPDGTRSCVLATIWDQVRGRDATETTDEWCFYVV